MTFLAMGIQRTLLMQEKSNYELQLIINSNYYNQLESEISELTADENPDECFIEALQDEQQYYLIQKTQAEAMLETIKPQIDGLNDVIKNNIKNECKISGGQ